MRLSLIKKKRGKKLQHKVKILLISVLFWKILFNVPIYSLYTPMFMTPLARMKGFSGNNLGDGPSGSSDDGYADDNTDSTVNEVKSRLAIENLSFTEESGDSEPDDGEELLSERWSDISSPDSYDNDFIDSSDDINDLSSDDNNSTNNQLTRKRLFTARHQSSTNSDCLESLHHESSFSDSNVSSDEILNTYDEIIPVITPVKKSKLCTPEQKKKRADAERLRRQNETPDNAERRRDQERDRARTKRATETPDNAERRLAANRLRAHNKQNAIAIQNHQQPLLIATEPIAPQHVQDHINGTFILFVLLYN